MSAVAERGGKNLIAGICICYTSVCAGTCICYKRGLKKHRDAGLVLKEIINNLITASTFNTGTFLR